MPPPNKNKNKKTGLSLIIQALRSIRLQHVDGAEAARLRDIGIDEGEGGTGRGGIPDPKSSEDA